MSIAFILDYCASHWPGLSLSTIRLIRLSPYLLSSSLDEELPTIRRTYPNRKDDRRKRRTPDQVLIVAEQRISDAELSSERRYAYHCRLVRTRTRLRPPKRIKQRTTTNRPRQKAYQHASATQRLDAG